MLPAVGFDTQPIFEADEVGNVEIVDDLLSPPPEAFEPSGAQDRPKATLGIGGLRPHRASAVQQQCLSGESVGYSLVRRGRVAVPTPPPLSRKGRGAICPLGHFTPPAPAVSPPAPLSDRKRVVEGKGV